MLATVIYMAEAATVLWFVAFMVLMAHQYRIGRAAQVGRQDLVGRSFLRNTYRAVLLGLGLVFSYQLAASVNRALDLGLDLPL